MVYVLQNVVFPLDRDPDLLPLYADPDAWSVVRIEDEATPLRVSDNARLSDVLGRTRARVVAGSRVSFGAYFNAFPAAYWQHWTPIRDVRLTVRTTGDATILLFRSNGAGIRQRLDTRDVTGSSEATFDIALTQFSDGGWIWFDIATDAEDAIFEGAEWTTEQDPVRTGKASLGITTYNKPDYCVETLRALTESPEVLELVDRVFLVDQGTDRVDAQPDFPEVSEALGEQLELITQPNLGGSGGFARAMSETLKRPNSDFVQLLDDDVRIEPESLRRSIVFGRYTTKPTLVGGHMFDLLDRPKLHAWAEVVDERTFMWRNLFTEDGLMPHDFGVTNLRQTKKLHMRMDADYNGWWMCLIPTAAIRKVGLALPAFIKWDDAEFCLRAGRSGFPTVSMPGVALWHVSWIGKDDAIDWQAYFHARNRTVAALLHSKKARGGSFVSTSVKTGIKHLLMMQYYPAELRLRALRDVLSGPQHMIENISTAMPDARAAAKDFPETVVHKETDRVLRSRKGRPIYRRVRRLTIEKAPTGVSMVVFTVVHAVAHWFHKPQAKNIRMPEVEFAKGDANWWRIPYYDSALVSSADGGGKQIYTRDRERFRSMLLETLSLHARLWWHWLPLARKYRRQLKNVTSVQTWDGIFAGGEK
ncbi:glycosyltransferase [Microbacterium sp. JZ31]|uniref:glycosyltransferase n=1 Tax=Microbacterium sp. JZ31 TaxID=1906274 RepID=UPI001932DCB8|nr:glycosyltransferase [Microbacterium sp. JZ31]